VSPDEDQISLALQLQSQGERTAARTILDGLERLDGETGRRARAHLAVIDEEEGRLQAAAERWERLLAGDIEDLQAHARLAHLHRQIHSTAPFQKAPLLPTQTLVDPEAISPPRYEVVRAIGRGATSTVYLARDRHLGIDLALKVFHPPARLTEACRRFFAEARLVAGLRHPGVVAIIDLDEAARTLVMEYLPGGSLRERLVRARPSALPWDEVASLARSLLSTLAYVHACRIVHGDITPRNILFRGPEQPVLADFGSARIIDNQDNNDWAAGTPVYLAPEQLHGAASSPQTDLFAVGAILWEAMAGRPMRQHADLLAGRTGRPPLAWMPTDESSSARLATLIAGLTEDQPGQRPASAAQALEKLEQ
jgi:serine/threonine protein kinase